VPNGLLEALGSRQFLPPFGQKAVVMQTKAPPLVIITTNEERTLPDPFLRRCVVLHLRLPDDEPSASATAEIRAPERRSSKIPDRNLTVTLSDLLIRRGARHFPKADRGVLTKVAARLIADRTRARSQNQSLLPGQAEYLDLVRAVVASADSPEEQIANLELFAEFVLRKQVDR